TCLDPHRGAGAVERAAADGDIANSSGRLRSDRHARTGAQHAVADRHVLARAIHAQPIGIAAGFDCDAVVVAGDVAFADADVAAGIDVDPVRAGRLPGRAYHQRLDNDVFA